jgi:hypothetical protein
MSRGQIWGQHRPPVALLIGSDNLATLIETIGSRPDDLRRVREVGHRD